MNWVRPRPDLNQNVSSSWSRSSMNSPLAWPSRDGDFGLTTPSMSSTRIMSSITSTGSPWPTCSSGESWNHLRSVLQLEMSKGQRSSQIRNQFSRANSDLFILRCLHILFFRISHDSPQPTKRWLSSRSTSEMLKVICINTTGLVCRSIICLKLSDKSPHRSSRLLLVSVKSFTNDLSDVTIPHW